MASSLLHLGGGFSTEAMSLKVRRFLPPSWVYEHMLTMKLCVCVCVCVFVCVFVLCVCVMSVNVLARFSYTQGQRLYSRLSSSPGW